MEKFWVHFLMVMSMEINFVCDIEWSWFNTVFQIDLEFFKIPMFLHLRISFGSWKHGYSLGIKIC